MPEKINKRYIQTQFDQLHVQQHIWALDLQPAKKLKNPFIDNNINGGSTTSRSSQTFPLRYKLDKTENYGSCEFYKKGGCRFSVFGEIELFFMQHVVLPRMLISPDSMGNHSGLPNNK